MVKKIMVILIMKPGPGWKSSNNQQGIHASASYSTPQCVNNYEISPSTRSNKTIYPPSQQQHLQYSSSRKQFGFRQQQQQEESAELHSGNRLTQQEKQLQELFQSQLQQSYNPQQRQQFLQQHQLNQQQSRPNFSQFKANNNIISYDTNSSYVTPNVKSFINQHQSSQQSLTPQQQTPQQPTQQQPQQPPPHQTQQQAAATTAQQLQPQQNSPAPSNLLRNISGRRTVHAGTVHDRKKLEAALEGVSKIKFDGDIFGSACDARIGWIDKKKSSEKEEIKVRKPEDGSKQAVDAASTNVKPAKSTIGRSGRFSFLNKLASKLGKSYYLYFSFVNLPKFT
ncbi:hypothetical protein HELRODRAFT_179509 [Helobdella robusta]|uniref:Uncharacterized protein n=1 Tax=Helobdella robusta TaxID=6412 RepID=T1FET5_HELRO|nr:hypothetical protein HELRODRAFT_179509 [Helobdella robusta]ESN95433.1 hypothetical protein HELRODRAFT_179509 [Helobdella robusta]